MADAPVTPKVEQSNSPERGVAQSGIFRFNSVASIDSRQDAPGSPSGIQRTLSGSVDRAVLLSKRLSNAISGPISLMSAEARTLLQRMDRDTQMWLSTSSLLDSAVSAATLPTAAQDQQDTSPARAHETTATMDDDVPDAATTPFPEVTVEPQATSESALQSPALEQKTEAGAVAAGHADAASSPGSQAAPTTDAPGTAQPVISQPVMMPVLQRIPLNVSRKPFVPRLNLGVIAARPASAEATTSSSPAKPVPSTTPLSGDGTDTDNTDGRNSARVTFSEGAAPTDFARPPQRLPPGPPPAAQSAAQSTSQQQSPQTPVPAPPPPAPQSQAAHSHVTVQRPVAVVHGSGSGLAADESSPLLRPLHAALATGSSDISLDDVRFESEQMSPLLHARLRALQRQRHSPQPTTSDDESARPSGSPSHSSSLHQRVEQLEAALRREHVARVVIAQAVSDAAETFAAIIDEKHHHTGTAVDAAAQQARLGALSTRVLQTLVARMAGVLERRDSPVDDTFATADNTEVPTLTLDEHAMPPTPDLRTMETATELLAEDEHVTHSELETVTETAAPVAVAAGVSGTAAAAASSVTPSEVITSATATPLSRSAGATPVAVATPAGTPAIAATTAASSHAGTAAPTAAAKPTSGCGCVLL